MPRVIIPVEKLPYPGQDGKHKIRFRITTKDYNEISEWSPIFVLDSTGQVASASASYTFDINTTTYGQKTITLSWDDVMPLTDVENHDIFIDWDQTGNYTFFKRNSGNSIIINVPVLADYVQIKVQMPSYPIPPSEDDIYKLFETEVIAL
jgi:hypothetical protein